MAEAYHFYYAADILSASIYTMGLGTVILVVIILVLGYSSYVIYSNWVDEESAANGGWFTWLIPLIMSAQFVEPPQEQSTE